MHWLMLLWHSCTYVLAREAVALFTGPSVHGHIRFSGDANDTLLQFGLALAGANFTRSHLVRLHASYVTMQDANSPHLVNRCMSAGNVTTDFSTTIELGETVVNVNKTTSEFTVAQVANLASIVVYEENGVERLACANIIDERPLPLARIASADWWPSLWVLLGICFGCIILERTYRSCRKVTRRRDGRDIEGFAPVPVAVENSVGSSFNDRAAFEIEMADDVLSSDEEDPGRTLN